MSLRIERALPEQSAVLSAIAFAAKRHWGYPEALIALWADELAVSPEYIGEQRVFVARDSGRAVGWYAIEPAGSGWSLESCWVLPEAMGRGIGRALIAHAKTELARAGANTLEVVSDPNACAFYERMGFRQVGDCPSRPAGRRLPLLVYRCGRGDAGVMRDAR